MTRTWTLQHKAVAAAIGVSTFVAVILGCAHGWHGSGGAFVWPGTAAAAGYFWNSESDWVVGAFIAGAGAGAIPGFVVLLANGHPGLLPIGLLFLVAAGATARRAQRAPSPV